MSKLKWKITGVQSPAPTFSFRLNRWCKSFSVIFADDKDHKLVLKFVSGDGVPVENVKLDAEQYYHYETIYHGYTRKPNISHDTWLALYALAQERLNKESV